MSALEDLHHAVVQPDEIDELGHMNVRFYLAKAVAGARSLAGELGIEPHLASHPELRFDLVDAFTRHYREQLEGAELVVRGGVLDATDRTLTLYLELVNTRDGETGATFIQTYALRDRDQRTRAAFPSEIIESSLRRKVAVPDHGKPRTLDLSSVIPEAALGRCRERDLSIRPARTIRPDECDAEGRFHAWRYQDLLWGLDSVEQQLADIPLFKTEDGGTFGWATLESRGVIVAPPRVGDRIQSFGAELIEAPKISHRNQWSFNLDTGELLCASAVVNLAFDIGKRRATTIPPAVRETLRTSYFPDMA